MTLKEKAVLALYITTSVAVVAHAATEIYVTFKRESDYKKKMERIAKNEI